MAGAHIHQVTKEEYTRVGSTALGAQLAAELAAKARAMMGGRVLGVPQSLGLGLSQK